MRVGVYAGADTPENGGAYTFVRELIGEIERRASDGRHRFTLIRSTEGGAAERLETLVIPAYSSSDLPTRARRGVRRAIKRALDIAPPLSAPNEAAEELLVRAGVEVVWYLVPSVCLTPDVPYITVVWDLQHRLQPYFPEVSAHGQAQQREALALRVLQRAALTITGTAVGRDELARFYGVAPERTRLLPHPTPGDALRAGTELLPRPAVAPAGPYLLYPAQFWPHKNHVNLLNALALLRTRAGLPLQLVLVGSDKGNLEFVKRCAAQIGVDNATHFLGFVDRDSLLALYQHAFALSYVTFFGPENLPPLEAFAMGCPVVASDVAGAREQLGDAALLVDPTSPEQIAAAVQRLYAEPELRAAQVERGRLRARRFTGPDFVDGVIRWLDEFEPVRRCWPGGAR